MSNPPFEGAPNAIALEQSGTVPTIVEGGPPGTRVLPPGSRLTIRDAQCSALVGGGVDCENGGAGFRFVAGELTRRGPELTPSKPVTVAATTAEATTGAALGAPMGVYTDGTDPVEPGTVCGAATGRRVVKVVAGSISCSDAIAVMDAYVALPPGDYGNANIRAFEGWSCASPTAARSAELGYGMSCTRGDVQVVTPR
ncbi:hypothetical protein ACFRFQ_16710 [Rhodococcus sp. NPDC056743]|uniref:hypothetical protein n=1 Tax=Rhodococcus sp. NPDC056743 TaxID=3345934 RepID=UPI00366FDD8C